jgi:hypothetical protein
VLVTEVDVVIFEGSVEVARHRRRNEPHQRVVDSRHFDGLYRTRDDSTEVSSSSLVRSLDVYADIVGGGA